MYKKIILSIKPFFSNEIYKGNKTVELRRRIGIAFNPGTEIYIYSTAPLKSITGSAKILRVDCIPVKQIIEQYLNDACINASDCLSYYNKREFGYLVWLCEIKKFSKPLELSKLREYNFTPPQSFSYASQTLSNLVNLKCQ